jgi:hypothetical protein
MKDAAIREQCHNFNITTPLARRFQADNEQSFWCQSADAAEINGITPADYPIQSSDATSLGS